MSKRICRLCGFTLLEVILALSLSVVLMALIGGAMQFFVRDLNLRDLEIRQVHIASAVLQMIEDDLRAAAHAEPLDVEAFTNLLTSAAGQAAGGAAGGEEDLSAAGITTDLPSEEVSVTDNSDLTTGSAVLTTPGLIGNQFQIQVDVSRLPRLEEYTVMMDENTTDYEDIPSDLKTVTYFVQPSGVGLGVQDALNAVDPNATIVINSGGLVRRVLDRMATAHASSSGGISMLNQTGDLLAPEVVSIEFAYWDGALWQISWNSDEETELPLAVKVQIAVADSAESAAALADPTSAAVATVPPRTFTHVVRLPLARPVDTTESTMTTETTSTTGTTSQSTSGTSP